WMWLCPVCGKPCRKVYLPLPPLKILHDVPRLAQIIDIPPYLPLPSRERIEERVKRESSNRAPSDQPRQRSTIFACYRCHQIARFSRVNRDMWNVIIAHL